MRLLWCQELFSQEEMWHFFSISEQHASKGRKAFSRPLLQITWKGSTRKTVSSQEDLRWHREFPKSTVQKEHRGQSSGKKNGQRAAEAKLTTNRATVHSTYMFFCILWTCVHQSPLILSFPSLLKKAKSGQTNSPESQCDGNNTQRQRSVSNHFRPDLTEATRGWRRS